MLKQLLTRFFQKKNDAFKVFLLTGSLEKVKAIIDEHPELLLKKNSAGETLLHKAAAYGNTPIVAYLIEKGVPVDIQAEPLLGTPLMLAVAFGEKETAQSLLEKGANVNAQDKDGVSSLHLAVFRELPEMVELLISHGANTALTDEVGRTPKMVAKENGLSEIEAML